MGEFNNNYRNDNVKPYEKNMDKIKHAEKIMKEMQYEKKPLTTNQMRIILSLFVNVRNELEKNRINNELTKDEIYEIKYIKIKLIYQAARMENKKFIEKSYLREMIDDVSNKQDFYKLVDYVEALVAFQKYYIEK